jgi:D-cysteine desulfhydrase
VSAVAARLGLNAVLAVKGSRPEFYDGNLLLDRLLGAQVRYLSDAEWEHVDEVMAGLAADLADRGHRPYVIPESGSNEVGRWAISSARWSWPTRSTTGRRASTRW